MMTAYLALKGLPLNKRVRVAPYASIPAESLLGVPAGTRISVRDLLYGLILRSGNDAAYTLAQVTAGSQQRFVSLMNRRAAALGLANTRYANPIGLDEAGNYSSAEDLATLARRLLAIPAFARIADARDEELDSLSSPLYITTRNTLLLRAPYATGVKTGYTLGAGYVLVASATRNGTKLISAVLGAPSELARDTESLELLDYGFSLYSRERAVRPGEVLATPEIRYSDGELALRALRGVSIGLRQGQQLDVKVRAPGVVEGPVRRGARIGTATVLVDGRPTDVIPLTAARAVPEATAFERVRSKVEDNPIVLFVAVCVILLVLIVVLRLFRRRGRADRGFGDDEIRSDREQRRADRESERRRHLEGDEP